MKMIFHFYLSLSSNAKIFKAFPKTFSTIMKPTKHLKILLYNPGQVANRRLFPRYNLTGASN